MTRAIVFCLATLLVAACGVDGPPEPVGDPMPEPRSIGVSDTITVEGVL